jgi:hypothetical protein
MCSMERQTLPLTVVSNESTFSFQSGVLTTAVSSTASLGSKILSQSEELANQHMRPIGSQKHLMAMGQG